MLAGRLPQGGVPEPNSGEAWPHRQAMPGSAAVLSAPVQVCLQLAILLPQPAESWALRPTSTPRPKIGSHERSQQPTSKLPVTPPLASPRGSTLSPPAPSRGCARRHVT